MLLPDPLHWLVHSFIQVFFKTFIIVISCSALPFGVTTETLATQDPEAEDEETDTPIYEKYDAMLHGKRKDRK